MNRNEEFIELKNELVATPVELEYIAVKAINRAKRSNKRFYRIKTPLTSFCCIAILFVLLVNLFPAVALAMSNVPILKELVCAVAIDPSLKAAVENDYYQLVGESQTKEEVTVTIDYMIVDAEHISLFYHVDAPVKAGNARFEIIEADGSMTPAVINFDTLYEVDKLEEVKIDYMFLGTVPDKFLFNVILNVDSNFHTYKSATIPTEDEVTASAINSEPQGVDYHFLFELHPNRQYTKTVENIQIGKWLEINGQHIYIKNLDIYPSQSKLNLEFDPNNSSIIDGLDVLIKDDKGNVYSCPENGIISSTDSPTTKTLYIESNYFTKVDHLTLYINGIRLKRKDKLYGEIDYTNKTISNLPADISIDKMELNDSTLTFILKAKEEKPNTIYSLISPSYRDREGNVYDFCTWDQIQVPDQDGFFYIKYQIKHFDINNLYRLEWQHTTVQKLDNPIIIEIK